MAKFTLIQRTCLQPNYSLRKQLFLAFGTTASVSIIIVMLIGLLCTWETSEGTKSGARNVIYDSVLKRAVGTSSRYVAEEIHVELETYKHSAELLSEVIRDRFVGYPYEYFNRDDFVPFEDMITGQLKYPLNAPLIPLDWNITNTVNQHTYEEYMGTLDRSMRYSDTVRIDPSNAVYFMQGTCNPLEKDPTQGGYYLGCSQRNNDIITGGAVQPTSTNRYIHQKVSDISFVMRAIFEYRLGIRAMFIIFANDGAGSTVFYPGFTLNWPNTSYTSVGCDWMRATNIFDPQQKPIGSEKQIKRCRKAGTVVTGRDYNGLERSFCRDQVLQTGPSNEPIVIGPYVNIFGDTNVGFGKPVFDRLTGKFIACTFIDVTAADINDIVKSVSIGDTSEIVLVRWETGDFIASNFNHTNQPNNITAYFPHDIYLEMKNLVNYSQPWDPEEVRSTYGSVTWDLNDDRIVMISPVPIVPEVYDPDYYPQFMVLVSVEYTNTEELDRMDRVIDEDAFVVYQKTFFSGVGGYVIILILIWFVVRSLTRPLEWMLRVTRQIIEKPTDPKRSKGGAAAHGAADGGIGHSGNLGHHAQVDHNTKDTRTSQHQGTEELKFAIKEYEYDVINKFTIQTELTSLVLDFGYMLDGFSGEGAAQTARQPIQEVKNEFKWKDMYFALYDESEDIIEDELDEDENFDNDDEDEEDDLNNPDDVFTDEPNDNIAAMRQSNIFQNRRDTFIDSMKGFLSRRKAGLETATKTTPEKSFRHRSVSEMPRQYTGSDDMFTAPPRLNLEPIIVADPNTSSDEDDNNNNSNTYDPIPMDNIENNESSGNKKKDKQEEIRSILTSPLFYWIAGLIATPTLVTMAVICTLTTFNLLETLPKWLGTVQGSTVETEKAAIVLATKTKAEYIEEIMNQAFGDLHVYARTAGWLLFGALQRTDSFTAVTSGVNECKYYTEDLQSCPYLEDERESVACDCEWRENPKICQRYEEDSRYLQKRWYAGQSQDADPNTGDRTHTSFPLVDTSPETTMWWESPQEMPGSYKGHLASGYSTTYDRVRVLSPMAILDIALYNYRRQPTSALDRYTMTYLGFEADGMLMSYSGCRYSYVNYSSWQSTEANNGPNNRPELCPENKYGYDCRCRDWYEQGKIINGSYVTPLYQFVDSNAMGTTITSPLIDPSTGAYIGVAALDFKADGLFNAIRRPNLDIGDESFAFLMATQSKNFKTEVGVDAGMYNLPLMLSVSSVEDEVLPHDTEDSRNRKEFRARMLSVMREGRSGSGSFPRRTRAAYEWDISNTLATSWYGEEEEQVFISFEPIHVRSLTPISPGNFSAGTYSSLVHIYTLAIVVPERELSESFSEIETRVERLVILTSALMITFIFIQSVVVIVVTYKLSRALLQPIHALSTLVRSINDRSLNDDEVQRVDGGSLEVQKVYEAFEKLYRVVRFSNTAFFSGNIDQSLRSLLEAQSIFDRLGNKKAMGVVSNNIGILVSQQRKLGELQHGFYRHGKDNFDVAVSIGFSEKEKSVGTSEYGDYVAQLANRCFNRAIYLMLTADHMDFTHVAMEDISHAKKLDQEAYMWYIKTRRMDHYVAEMFDMVLSRTRGMLQLVRDYGLPNDKVWGIDTLIKQAESILIGQWENPKSKLFQSLSRIGRYQQIMDLIIQYEFYKDNIENAARIAIKLLVEDSYIIDTVFANAVTVVNIYFKETTKNVILCLDYSASMDGDKIKRASKNCRFIYNKFCYDEDYVGFIRFNNKIDTNLSFPLEQKAEYETYHKLILSQVDNARGGSNLYQALDYCVDMVASISMNNTWIVALTDGDSWDDPEKVIHRIRTWNAKRSNKIHVLIISFGEQTRNNQKIAKECKRICNSISQQSFYIDASSRKDNSLHEMEKAFEQVAYVMSSGGLTMESF